MDSGGSFVMSLRRDWTSRFAAGVPFYFRAVAGDRDEFVPAFSSVEPFMDDVRAVVPGNHLEIVRPASRDHQSVALIAQALSGQSAARGHVDSARLAVELGNFQSAVDTFLPVADGLDDAALASLALALDGLGRGKEALEVLERHYRAGKGLKSTDALGVLAGKVKRRWLIERSAADLERARTLYSDGLSRALADKDYEQAYYHGINIAFLDLMASSSTSRIPAAVQEMAGRVREYCASAERTHWRLATEGEACLMLREIDGAEERYRQAIAMCDSPREIYSMYSQAVRVAERVFGKDGVHRIERVFDVAKVP